MRPPAATSWRVACVTSPAATPSSARKGGRLVLRATTRAGRASAKVVSRPLRSLPGASHVPDHRLGRPGGGLREPQHPRHLERGREAPQVPEFARRLLSIGRGRISMGSPGLATRCGRAGGRSWWRDISTSWRSRRRASATSSPRLGTALTLDQLHLLRRFTRDIVVCFDGDAAGARAAERASRRFSKPGSGATAPFSRRTTIPTRSCSARVGTPRSALIAGATPLLDFYLDRAVRPESTVAERGVVAQQVAAWLRKIADPFEYDMTVRHAAERLRVPEESLRRHAGAPTPTASPSSTSTMRATVTGDPSRSARPLTSNRRRKRRARRSCW